ncbi:MAG: hypothetical protein E7537_05685 [Ruminococcaceae bacterium]|nr:hypothetical protein [Oscillospiraceae bacterium]
MKNTKKITFCAIMSALAAVIMLVSYFPYFTYAVPAVAGLCVMAVLIELGAKWSVLTYFSSAFLAFLFAEIESKLIYIAFFGFYPILKCVFEKFSKPFLEWVLKIVTFNVCIVTLYFVFSKTLMFDISEFGKFAKYGVLGLICLANVVFVLYDIAVSRMAQIYIIRISPKIEKFLK